MPVEKIRLSTVTPVYQGSDYLPDLVAELSALQAVDGAGKPDDAWLAFYRRRALNPRTTPLQKAWGVVRDDASVVRQAVDLEGVRRALDEVEKSLTVLRSWFWKTKASKRD